MTAHRVPHRRRYLLDWGRGLRVTIGRCVVCGHRWVVVVPIGTTGQECPGCGFFDPAVYWGDPRATIYCDGFWTTGEWFAAQVALSQNGRFAVASFHYFGGAGQEGNTWRATPSA
jgi:hypothetical protein